MDLSPCMVVTDLDGTLLDDRRVCAPQDRATLVQLGRHGIVRVVATGRSLHSARRVLPPDFPIDYLVFSAGAGVMAWHTQALLLARHLAPADVARAVAALAARRLDVAVLDPVPDSHWFTAVATAAPHPDFVRRRALYGAFERPGGALPERACQLIAITAPEPGLVEDVRAELPELNVVRTTSPLDHASLWIEVFPPDVSKATAAAFVAGQLSVPPVRTLAVGNDYNDLDLLAWASDAAMVGNAPADLRARYPAVADNNGAGFSAAVAAFLARV